MPVDALVRAFTEFCRTLPGAAFYNAIAVLIEQECKLLAVPLVHLTHKGFGRALISVGKLLAVDRTLRDVHRFGFPRLSKMKDEADKILALALERIGQYPALAGLQEEGGQMAVWLLRSSRFAKPAITLFRAL